MKHYQPVFFDEAEKLKKLEKLGDPLVELKRYIDFERFRDLLEEETGSEAKQKRAGGRPGYDGVFMFKVLILQRLYNLSDEELEYQINDRQSFQRFLDLHLGSSVPDYTSIWRFREKLTESGKGKRLFDLYERKMEEQGVITKSGTIVDASFVEVPRQRNSRKDNEMIKSGGVPEEWKDKPHKLSQKDVDARWAKKNNETFFGYKEHDMADADSKMIRDFETTSAEIHDSKPLSQLVDERNKDENLFADSAYKSKECDKRLAKLEINNYIHEKGTRNHPLNELQKLGNKIKSQVRCRIEHIFGHIENSMGGPEFEYIGIARIKTAVALRNLTYNFVRYVQLIKLGKIVPEF
jgi:IS5 family transposase